MATNQKFDRADSISLPVAADTEVGKPVAVGAFMGTTRTAEGEGGNADGYATVDLVGPYEHTVTGALASVGLPVYITSGGALTTTATDNTLWGYNLTTKSSGSGLATVRPARI